MALSAFLPWFLLDAERTEDAHGKMRSVSTRPLRHLDTLTEESDSRTGCFISIEFRKYS